MRLVYSVVYFAAAIAIAARRILTNDELFTYYITLRPRLQDIWDALKTGAEQTPPLVYLLTRVSFGIFGVNHISIRRRDHIRSDARDHVAGKEYALSL